MAEGTEYGDVCIFNLRRITMTTTGCLRVKWEASLAWNRVMEIHFTTVSTDTVIVEPIRNSDYREIRCYGL